MPLFKEHFSQIIPLFAAVCNTKCHFSKSISDKLFNFLLLYVTQNGTFQRAFLIYNSTFVAVCKAKVQNKAHFCSNIQKYCKII